MKLIKASQSLAIPEGVELSIKARKIRVKGPRGASCSPGVPQLWLRCCQSCSGEVVMRRAHVLLGPGPAWSLTRG